MGCCRSSDSKDPLLDGSKEIQPYVSTEVTDVSTTLFDTKEPDNEKPTEVESPKSKPNDPGKWDGCKSVELCKPLQRILNNLKWWNNTNSSTEDVWMQYFDNHKREVIDDYHHILDHLNEDIIHTNIANINFCLIHQQITNNKLVCDVQECEIYHRHNRQRETSIKYKNATLEALIDIFDSIHCYFMHSVDTGYRINGMNLCQFNDDKDMEISMKELKLYLAPKIKQLENIRGSNRISNTKFVTTTSVMAVNDAVKEDEKKHAEIEVDPNFYCFGKSLHDFYFPIDPRSAGLKYVQCPNKHELRQFNTEQFGFVCDGCNKRVVHDPRKADSEFYGCRSCNFDLCDDCYVVKGKYDSLKEEILSNTIYSLDINVFNAAYEKAVNLKDNSSKIKSMQANIDKYNSCYLNYSKLQTLISSTLYSGMFGKTGDPDHPLSLNRILSVILYTDYDTLSYNFSLTFRNSKHIDKEYWIWSKTLIQTVNLYGTNIKDTNNTLYHGTSMLYFTSLCTSFNCPTSTTTKLSVAAIFAKTDGLILDLKAYTTDSSLRYLNCSYFSTFANEEERLFITPPIIDMFNDGMKLKIENIRNMATNEDYKDTIDAIAAFETTITDGNVSESTESIQNIICQIIENNMNETEHNDISFISQITKQWIKKQTTVRLNMWTLHKSFLKKYFVVDNMPNDWNLSTEQIQDLFHSLVFDKINMVFKNVETIICDTTQRVTASYLKSMLKMLQNINNLKYSKLKEIKLYGVDDIRYNGFATFLKEYESSYKQNQWLLKIANSNLPYIRVINMNYLNEVDMRKKLFIF